jgi:predicted phosphodiesterase
VRLVLASDTHDRHHGLTVPDGDVFIHAGDFTMNGNLKAVGAFGVWIRALPHRYKIVIAGNHDRSFENTPVAAREALRDGADGLIYLQDTGVTLEGISFWGSPWQPWFRDWAFNLQRGAEIAAKWDLIPAGTDVLITHGPPMGILDVVPAGGHVGCADLLERIGDIRPPIHAFGHIHEGSGIEERGGTTFVNASICNGAYHPANPLRVVDIG